MDDYEHVMQLEDGNSQVPLACVNFPSHNQTSQWLRVLPGK